VSRIMTPSAAPRSRRSGGVGGRPGASAMRWRSSRIATSPSKVPRGALPRRGGGSRGRDGGDGGGGDAGGGDDCGGDDCAGDEDCTARNGMGSAGGRRGRLRLAASSDPTVRTHLGAYFNGPGSGSRSRVLIVPSERNATHTLTLHSNALRTRTLDTFRSAPASAKLSAEVIRRAKAARGAMIRCCSDDARPTRRRYMSGADVAAAGIRP
jgi:hypothetical protein